jgi:DNA polymerase-3 subunit delta
MIRGEALAGALKSARTKGLPPILWIASDEALLRQEAADAVRACARELGFEERSVFQVERGFKLEAVLAQTQALSLFSSRKLLEVRIPGKPGKELGEGLGTAAQSLDEDIRVLVTSPRLDRATSESAWFARIEAAGLAVAIPEIARAQLPGWIGERLARNGQQADAATLTLIAERVEGNLLAADQEVRKLALVLPAGRLSADAVRAAVLDVARWDAFDLVDAALAGDTPRTLRCVAGLRAEGTAVPVVLWALADAVRNLIRLSQATAAGTPLPGAMRALRIWGERERLYPQALRRLPPARLHQLLRACIQADRITKGVGAGDDWQMLEAITLGLAGAPSLALHAEQDAIQ